MESKGEAASNKVANNIKIGFVTMQAIRPEQGVASSRIRVEWVCNYLENTFITEDEKVLSKCDVVVFQTRIETKDIELAKRLKAKGRKIIADFTDPHWLKEYGGTITGNLKEMIALADVITLPTENLKASFDEHFPGKQTRIIADRIDLALYSEQRVHKQKDQFVILWHGSFGNRACLDLARDDLEKLGMEFNLKLVCVYDNSDHYHIPKFHNLEVETVEWSNDRVIEELLKSDVSINPRYDDWRTYKSNNKTITAWALGVPCVEYNFYAEIRKLLKDVRLRRATAKAQRNVIEKEYSVKKSAAELKDLCMSLIRTGKAKRKNNIAVYTSICGNYNGLREDIFEEPYSDYIAFIDDDSAFSYAWDIRHIYKQFIDPMREAKIFKVLPWQYLSEYEYSIWIDGSIAIKAPASHLVEMFLDGADMALFQHSKRDCIYEEYIADIAYRTREPVYLRELQRDKYRREGMPEHNGLYECGVIIRRHTDKVIDCMNTWWSEISAFSASDQCSFIYSVWRHGVKINTITPGNVYSNPYFHYVPHSKTWRFTVNGEPEEESAPQTEVVPTLDGLENRPLVKIKRMSRETFHSHETGRMNFEDIREISGVMAKALMNDYPQDFMIYEI